MCLSPEEIAAYVSHAVSGQEKARLDTHFRTCDACLLEVVEARRITDLLDPQKLGPVPERLTAKAEALGQPSSPASCSSSRTAACATWRTHSRHPSSTSSWGP